MDTYESGPPGPRRSGLLRGSLPGIFWSFRSFRKNPIGGIIGGIIGVVILLSLYRLMVVGKILIFENLGVGTLPTPPN